MWIQIKSACVILSSNKVKDDRAGRSITCPVASGCLKDLLCGASCTDNLKTFKLC